MPTIKSIYLSDADILRFVKMLANYPQILPPDLSCNKSELAAKDRAFQAFVNEFAHPKLPDAQTMRKFVRTLRARFHGLRRAGQRLNAYNMVLHQYWGKPGEVARPMLSSRKPDQKCRSRPLVGNQQSGSSSGQAQHIIEISGDTATTVGEQQQQPQQSQQQPQQLQQQQRQRNQNAFNPSTSSICCVAMHQNNLLEYLRSSMLRMEPIFRVRLEILIITWLLEYHQLHNQVSNTAENDLLRFIAELRNLPGSGGGGGVGQNTANPVQVPVVSSTVTTANEENNLRVNNNNNQLRASHFNPVGAFQGRSAQDIELLKAVQSLCNPKPME